MSEKKVVSLKTRVPICPNKDMAWEDRIPFTSAERTEMCRTGEFVCPRCKTFTNKAVSGKIWNVHHGRWIQEAN